jgi:hypothetical protein
MVLMQAERLFKGDKNSLRLLGVVTVQLKRRDNFLLSRDVAQGACYVRFGLHEMMQLALPIHAHLLTGGSAIGLSATGAYGASSAGDKCILHLCRHNSHLYQ